MDIGQSAMQGRPAMQVSNGHEGSQQCRVCLQCRLALDIGQSAMQGRPTVQVSNGHRAVRNAGYAYSAG